MASRFLQARILASVLFSKDMEVGRQEGHQPQPELGLKRERENEEKEIEEKEIVHNVSPYLIDIVDSRMNAVAPVVPWPVNRGLG